MFRCQMFLHNIISLVFFNLIVVKLGKMLPETVINIATTVNKYQTARNSGQTTHLKLQKFRRSCAKKLISSAFKFRWYNPAFIPK
jgi:hypothetical protein